jgi:GntR family transcriptional repressor for pyruvate dehydrogenase complex
LSPIKSRRVVETVVERLEEPILSGRIAEGEKLPSEEQLAAQLGVGRRAVREALKVLETKGLVETQMGVGTVVCRNDLSNFLDTLARNVSSYLRVNRAEARHVMELRLLLEGTALERLARSPKDERLAKLAADVSEQRKAHLDGDYQKYQVWHFRFHQDVVDALQNPVISMIYGQVMSLMREPMERSGSYPQRTERSIADHEQMLKVIQDGSQADVRHHLRRHLEDFFVHMQD